MADSDESSTRPTRAVSMLEVGDGFAHLLVAYLLLFLALGILIASTTRFVQDLTSGSQTLSFAQTALNYLSDLLFGVIVLELLSTIITYIRARKLESTVKDFLVVGLISSVRKILLTGAQSSLIKPTTHDYIEEATGTLLTIVGICLLIGALYFLDQRNKQLAKNIPDPE